jgi:hypothetical protein
MISGARIIGQNWILEIPPTKGQFRYKDHIANFLKFLGSFDFGKLTCLRVNKKAGPWLTLPAT